MKKFTLIIVLCNMLFALDIQAQEITFSYDKAGNMINRKIVFSKNLTEQYIDTVEINNHSDSTETIGQENYKDKLGKQDIIIYPNPTRGKLTVNIPEYQSNPNDNIKIIDMQGTLRQRISPISSSNTLNIRSYPPATYIMLIQINGKSTQWKIVKQ